MATPLIGINGNVTIAAALGGLIVNDWNATVDRASLDVSGFGNYAPNRLMGMFDIKGSATGIADGAISPFLWVTATAPATITLQSDTGNSIAFPAIIVSAGVGNALRGDAKAALNFEMSMGTSTATSFTLATVGITATWTS